MEGRRQTKGYMIFEHLQNFQYVVELEKSFQEWCNTWGPFRSRRVSDRAEDLRLRAVREKLSLGRSTPRGRARPGYLLNYLINYLIK